MKLVVFISILFCLSNVQADSNDDVHKFFEFLWKALEAIASKVHLHPDTGMSIDEFLTKYNYPLKTYNVTTNDSYILTIHRINEETKKNAVTNKPVVLLVHGLACSSMDWVFPGPNSSLALLLADEGYDVWLANLRGNSYSAHEDFTRKDSSFWDYSFHERGFYDLPAIIDFILESTGNDKLTYVGHSEGTTNGLVLTSTRPEYNEKINLMALLSPVAYMGNLTSPLVQLLGQNESVFKLLMSLLKVNGVSYSPLVTLLVDVFCNDDSSMQDLCIAGLSLLAGFDVNQINKSMITVFFSNMPSGTSVKEIDHYLQEWTSGYFRQYDYGTVANYFYYGSDTPPSYDIRKVTVPLAVYYAKNDFLSSVLDVEKFIYQLTVDTVDRDLIDYDLFNHMDFLIAKDIKTLLYNRVIETINKHNPLP